MRAVRATLLALAFTAACASQARSSEEWAFEAFQPIWTDNELYLSRVTVLTFNESGLVGISAVLATCDSNRVMSDYGPQQRNAAFEVGLRAEVAFSGQEPPLFGDTLRVILHETKPSAGIDDHDYATVLAATVRCVLLNAAQSSAIKFVALRVDGDEAHRKYGGVYSTTPFRKGPKQRGWSEP